MARRKKLEIGDKYYANGVECRVTHIYDNIFAVRSEHGTGVVRIKDMKLVGRLSRGNDVSNRRLRHWN